MLIPFKTNKIAIPFSITGALIPISIATVFCCGGAVPALAETTNMADSLPYVSAQSMFPSIEQPLSSTESPLSPDNASDNAFVNTDDTTVSPAGSDSEGVSTRRAVNAISTAITPTSAYVAAPPTVVRPPIKVSPDGTVTEESPSADEDSLLTGGSGPYNTDIIDGIYAFGSDAADALDFDESSSTPDETASISLDDIEVMTEDEFVEPGLFASDIANHEIIEFPDHGLPIISIWLNEISIDTVDNNGKLAKYPGNIVEIYNDGELILAQNEVEIKGRGNTTWGSPKKPYQIKFSSKQDLFGLGKAKKWVMLANYLDTSHLRNDLAFSLGQSIGLEYTSEGVYFELYVDGKYRGLYYLTAKLELNQAAVDLDSSYAVVVENDTVHTSGTDPTFRSATENSLIWLKDTGDDAFSEEAFQLFEQAYNKFERDVYAGNWNEILKDIDVTSFAKYYLLNEFVANQDANHASFYMYKDGPDDVIHAGPIWDFDLAFCGLGEFYDDPYQLWVYNDRYNLPPITSKLLTKLMDMPQFRAIVEELYSSTVSQAIGSLILSIDMKSSAINTAIAADADRWDLQGLASIDTSKMKNWMLRRKAFCDYIFQNRVNYITSAYVTLHNSAGYMGYSDNGPAVSEDMGYSSKPFVFESLGNGYYSIRQAATGLYLTDTNREEVSMDASGLWEYGQIAVNGKACTLEPWSAKEGQQWMVYRDGSSNSYRIINKNSSFFLSSDRNNRLVTTRWQDNATQIFSIQAADSLEDLRAEFVTHLYETCLGRQPDAKGLQDWVAAFERDATASQVIRGFVYSEEFINLNLSDESYVTALYAAVFGRLPDSSGLRSWLDVIDHGCSRDKVVSGFVKSTELSNLCRCIQVEVGTFRLTDIRDENTNITYFVDRLYRNCLGRKWDLDGLVNWVTLLSTNSVSGTQIVNAFLESDEFRQLRLNNRDFVRTLYLTLFGREADPEGLNGWVRSLSSGMSRSEVVFGFTSSSEFANLCYAAGIRP